MDIDLQKAGVVMGNLFILTARRHHAQPFAERALALLTTHWGAVEAVAEALLEEGRVEGARIERIIDHAMA
jgi:hypothetical protein